MENNKKMFGCVALGCGGIVMFALVFATGLFFTVTGFMKSSDAYTMAIERAESSPAIVEALGAPIEAGFMITGGINTSGPSGHADVSIPLSGPKGEGTLYVVAEKSAGLWSFTTLEFEGPTGTRVDVMPEKALVH